MNGSKTRNYLTRHTDEEITKIILESSSANEAAIKLGYDPCAREFIRKFIQEYGLKPDFTSNKKRRTYTLNEKFFKDMNNPLAVYWLGFIMADGNIDSRNNTMTLTIHLANKDRDHLVNFLQDIGSNSKLQEKKGGPVTIKGKEYHQQDSSTARISSKELVQSLIDLGCVPNKTKHGCQISNPQRNVALFYSWSTRR